MNHRPELEPLSFFQVPLNIPSEIVKRGFHVPILTFFSFFWITFLFSHFFLTRFRIPFLWRYFGSYYSKLDKIDQIDFRNRFACNETLPFSLLRPRSLSPDNNNNNKKKKKNQPPPTLIDQKTKTESSLRSTPSLRFSVLFCSSSTITLESASRSLPGKKCSFSTPL